MLYGFAIGREFKLSIAEILSVFPDISVLYSAKNIMIVEGLTEDNILNKASSLGGTIKIFEIKLSTDMDNVLNNISNIGKTSISKFNYGLNIFGEENIRLSKMLMNVKRHLKGDNISSRFVNKNDINLSSAQIIGNSLIKKGADLNIVDLNGIYYFGKTIWVQDIDAYSARDYGKSRDMDIGMLPPKLSQMMINLSKVENKEITSLYDPFIGLGTVLIEGAYMGIKKLYGSDFNEKMIQESKSNLGNLKSKISGLDVNIMLADARDTKENTILKSLKIDSIVTEGFLGEIMTQKNISLDRIAIQRKNLSKLYEKFFSGLKSVGFDGIIVISFPFWDFKGKYLYLEEVYDILNDYCEILPLFPSEFDFKETKSGSLLYKRQKQLVGREIFKLKIK